MPTCDMGRCREFAEDIPGGPSTHAFSCAAADNNIHLIAGKITNCLAIFSSCSKSEGLSCMEFSQLSCFARINTHFFTVRIYSAFCL